MLVGNQDQIYAVFIFSRFMKIWKTFLVEITFRSQLLWPEHFPKWIFDFYAGIFFELHLNIYNLRKAI